MKKIGIIDLGSNTIRLVVYSVKASNSFRVLVNEKRVVGLSSYVEDGELTNAGIEKAADVLNRHIKLAHNVGCDDIRIFATAVIRNLHNKKRVVNQLQKRIEHPIDVISGERESHLGFVGAEMSTSIKEGLLIDIGGGSTELTFIQDNTEYRNISLSMGSVSSYANFVGKILPLKREQIDIRKTLLTLLKETPDVPKEWYGSMYGIGGSVRALAKLHARLKGSDKSTKRLARYDLDQILELANADQNAFAHIVTKACPDRIHTILPGCIILQEVMKYFDKVSITVCKYGLREGYLKDQIK